MSKVSTIILRPLAVTAEKQAAGRGFTLTVEGFLTNGDRVFVTMPMGDTAWIRELVTKVVQTI